MSGNAVKDEAGRTVKYTEITLTVDGYVTLGDNINPTPSGASISPTMVTMHRLLTAQGGPLVYKGRGFDLVVNKDGGMPLKGGHYIARATEFDVAWGPVPELIDFQPLGGGLSAKVTWKVTVRVSPIAAAKGFTGITGSSSLLQFNYETAVSYGEDGYSSLTIRGVLEIPMTRIRQNSGTVATSADDYRPVIQRRILAGIDLSRFRVTRRDFNTSRDKRTLSFDFAVEEKSYMDLPPYCAMARGSYNVRPARSGPGLALWLCTLQATYTVRPDASRRWGYWWFLSMMRLRMTESLQIIVRDLEEDKSSGPSTGFKVGAGALIGAKAGSFFGPWGTAIGAVGGGIYGFFSGSSGAEKKVVEQARNAILIDFSINEGLYLDSKTLSLSATWRITCNLDQILLASGMWSKLKSTDKQGNNLWALSMRDVQGVNSYNLNQLNPDLDVIVDFGSSE